MNDFWKWIEKKRYSAYFKLPKQMLIGYMIEYLIEKKISFVIFDSNFEVCAPIDQNFCSEATFKKQSIEDIYQYLEDKINE